MYTFGQAEAREKLSGIETYTDEKWIISIKPTLCKTLDTYVEV